MFAQNNHEKCVGESMRPKHIKYTQNWIFAVLFAQSLFELQCVYCFELAILTTFKKYQMTEPHLNYLQKGCASPIHIENLNVTERGQKTEKTSEKHCKQTTRQKLCCIKIRFAFR